MKAPIHDHCRSIAISQFESEHMLSIIWIVRKVSCLAISCWLSAIRNSLSSRNGRTVGLTWQRHSSCLKAKHKDHRLELQLAGGRIPETMSPEFASIVYCNWGITLAGSAGSSWRSAKLDPLSGRQHWYVNTLGRYYHSQALEMRFMSFRKTIQVSAASRAHALEYVSGEHFSIGR